MDTLALVTGYPKPTRFILSPDADYTERVFQQLCISKLNIAGESGDARKNTPKVV